MYRSTSVDSEIQKIYFLRTFAGQRQKSLKSAFDSAWRAFYLIADWSVSPETRILKWYLNYPIGQLGALYFHLTVVKYHQNLLFVKNK